MMFDKLLEDHPYLGYLLVGVIMSTFVGCPMMVICMGILTGDWAPPWWFVVGCAAIGFVIGSLYYLIFEKL